jgi:hypothetical protein
VILATVAIVAIVGYPALGSAIAALLTTIIAEL